MADKISMADLLRRNVAIGWFEAVSLVREVCSVLVAERIEESTPELAQILLAPNGKVTVTGTAHAEAPVRRLGQLLQALLSRSSEPPVTLRLVLSEAMAVPPVYASVRDFDAALAYFERPDRQAVLKALYERVSELPPNPEPNEEIQNLDTIAPLPAEPTEAKKKRPRKPPNRRATALVAGVAVALAVVAVGYQRGLIFPGETVTRAESRAASAVDKAVFATVSAVTEAAGMGKLMPPGTVVPPDVPVPAKATTTQARRHAGAPSITLAGVPVKVFDLQPAAVVDLQSAVDSPSAVTPAVLEASTEPDPPAADSKVYGPEDDEVEAPMAVRPHLPTKLPDGVSASQLARIELQIAPDGGVESVKLLPGIHSVSVTEAMLLSAAKAWRFSPAMRAGHAVRYRKTVFLSEQQ